MMATSRHRQGLGREDRRHCRYRAISSCWNSLKRKLPGQLGDIATIPGLGPKRVKLLYDKLKVRTLDDFRRTLNAGRLRELRGFGPAIEKKISAALEKPPAEKRFKLSVAEAEAEALVGFLCPTWATHYTSRRDGPLIRFHLLCNTISCIIPRQRAA